MSHDYDLVVIGTGTAAMVVSARVKAAGWRVAVVDCRPFGGTCALRGCDPKKMLIGGASAVDHIRRMSGKGVVGEARIEWPELMAFKRTFTDPVPGKNEARFAAQDIEAFKGSASFVGPDTLEVAGVGRLNARRFVIASGAEAVKLGIPGEEHLLNNEDFLRLESLPARIAMVGGGYIAAEFSHVAARAGVKVTILQHADRLLTNFDPDLVGWSMKSYRALGIDVRLGASVESIEKTRSGFRVIASIAGAQIIVEADAVVHAAGRAPALDSLNLTSAGVETEKGKLKLNEFLQSVSNPAVYAAGDAAQMGPPLTPVSSHDAKVVAANLLDGNHARPDYQGVPSVVFTLPPMAAVGLSEAETRAQGLKFRMRSELVPTWFNARQAAEKVYGYKVLVDEETDLVLGAHLIGPHVDEVINIFALAIRHGLTAENLRTMMFAYPTGASDIGYML